MARLFYPGCRVILEVVLDGLGTDDDDSDPLIIPVLPKSATVHKNSYRQADSYEIGFDAGDLPFDPRIIRTGFAEVFFYQTDDLDPGGRVLSRKDPLAEPDPGAARVRDLIEGLALDVGVAQKDRFTYGNPPIVAGLFDRSSLELSSDGKWVTINGQDMTGHLASLQWKPEPNGVARRIPVGKRLDVLIGDLLDEADPLGKIGLVVRGIDRAALPIVGASEVRGSARGIPVDQGTKYWDVIYKIAERYGFVVFVEGVDVVLCQGKSINANDVSSVKLLTWGKNLEHLTLERELGKEQVPTIIAKGYDAATRQAITVEYPPNQIDHARHKPPSEVKVRGTEKRAMVTERHRAKAAVKKGKTTTTLRKRDEYQYVTVRGPVTRELLERAAQNRYHQLGKAERRCIAKTRDLKDMRESSMLTLTAGDAVWIDWDEFNRETLSDPNVPADAKVEHLVSRGFNRTVARAVATHYEQLAGLDRPLYVKEATYQYSADDGIEIELELHDFIMVDGIRSDSGAPIQPRGEKHRAGLVKHDGTPLGGSEAQRRANKARYGK